MIIRATSHNIQNVNKLKMRDKNKKTKNTTQKYYQYIKILTNKKGKHNLKHISIDKNTKKNFKYNTIKSK